MMQTSIKLTKEGVLKAYKRAILGNGYNVSFLAWLDVYGFIQTEENGYELSQLYDNDLVFDSLTPSESELSLVWTIQKLEAHGRVLLQNLTDFQETIAAVKVGYLTQI